MITLKNILSSTSKSRRHRRTILNIAITMFAWIVEFLGFFVVLLGTHVLGHENNVVNLTLQTLTNLIYFIIIPSVLFINESYYKDLVVESPLYTQMLRQLNLQYIDKNDEDEVENGEQRNYSPQSNKRNNGAGITTDEEHIIAEDLESNM